MHIASLNSSYNNIIFITAFYLQYIPIISSKRTSYSRISIYRSICLNNKNMQIPRSRFNYITECFNSSICPWFVNVIVLISSDTILHFHARILIYPQIQIQICCNMKSALLYMLKQVLFFPAPWHLL